jgi:6-phosphogluconolactonase
MADRQPAAASATEPGGLSVKRYADPDELARHVAASLIGSIARVQGLGRTPSLVLTGGSVADRVHAAVAASDEVGLVDWSDVEFWWGDERFVPEADPDRNAGQARAAMLDRLPVDPARVHAVAASDGPLGDDPDAAAAAYAAELAATLGADGPSFDILMLGVGPDGHCASLFPGRPEVSDPAPVLAVRGSPKPPPTRVSLGMSTLMRAREVWFVATGSEKAEVVTAALRGAEVTDVPAAGPKGTERTVWFVDRDAAWML